MAGGPDDLLNPDADVSMDAFADTFGPATADMGEFDLPPPAPSAPKPRPSPFASVAPQTTAEGVTININKAGKNGAPAVNGGPKPPSNDPLSWLASNVEGKLRIERKPGTGVTSNGRANRGKYRGKYVGIGDCDVVEVMGSQELKSHIVEHWGGGEYIIHHLDKRDQKISSSPPLRLAQDPKPIEGVSEEEEEGEGNNIDLSFLNNQQPQQPPPPQYDVYGRMIPTDPYGRPYQVPHTPSNPTFTPDWLQRNLDEEKSGLRESLEAEKEARRTAEMSAQQAAAQREHDRALSEQQRQADRMAAEMAAIKEALNKQPQNTGLDTMLQMMMKQQEAAQQRYENEARERRDREDREAKEARQKAEAERQERRDREDKAEKERRERDDRMEKERREDRRSQTELAQAEAKRSQDFMTMVLGQKVDPMKYIEMMKSSQGNQTDPMSALNMAFSVVERAKDLGGGGDDEPAEGGIAGAIRAMVPAVRPMAEAFARGMAGPQPVVYQRIPGNVQQLPMQQGGMPPPQQRPQQQAPQAPVQQGGMPPQGPPQSGGVDQTTFQVAKIVGMAGKGFTLNKDPEVIAAAMLGAANMAGLMDHIGLLATLDPTMIHSQLTGVLNVGLPQEQSQQIQSFLDIYTKPGGREWIKELIDEMNGVNEPDGDEDEPV